MRRHLSRLLITLVSTLAVAAVPVTTLVVGAGSATAADHARPAVSPNPRGVSVVAGIHDTAVNGCDQSGKLALPSPTTPLTSAQIAAAGASVNDPAFPAGVTTVRVTMPWDVADPGIVSGSAVYDKTTDTQRLYGVKACLDAWLRAVFAHGKQAEIDFRGDPSFAASNSQVLMPSMAQYTAAVTAFRNQYVGCGASCADGGQVKVVVPWNEPDNQGQSKIGSVYDLLFPDGQTHLAGSSCPAGP
jgi:hypothetical protein